MIVPFFPLVVTTWLLWALLPFLIMSKHPICLIIIYFGLQLLKMLWISLPFLTQEGLQSTLSFTMQVLISKHCFHFSLRSPHMHESFPKNFSLLNPKTFHNLSNQDIFPNTRYLFFFFFLGSAWKLLLSFTKTFSPPKKKHYMYISTQPKKSHLNLLLLSKWYPTWDA